MGELARKSGAVRGSRSCSSASESDSNICCHVMRNLLRPLGRNVEERSKSLSLSSQIGNTSMTLRCSFLQRICERTGSEHEISKLFWLLLIGTETDFALAGGLRLRLLSFGAKEGADTEGGKGMVARLRHLAKCPDGLRRVVGVLAFGSVTGTGLG